MRHNVFLFVWFGVLGFSQVSFLPHFPIAGIVPNVFFLCFILFSALEKTDSNRWVALALSGGILLDSSLSPFIGFWVLILLGSGFGVQFIKRRYMRTPRFFL